jgi:hypothetical protein
MSDDFEDRPWALIAMLPADEDVNAASSEDIAHMTTIWFGEPTDTFDLQSIAMDVKMYAREATPVTVPVNERGTLGDDEADVLFLEATESLLAFRDGLLDHPAIREAHDAAEQYLEWTPHVTLGYPEAPARAEYSGEQITFDRLAVWVGNDRMEYPMGKGLTASADIDIDVEDPDLDIPEDVDMDDEDLVDDLVDEIPVHGVATIEGKPTGDGRGFMPNAVQFPPLPAPLGFEYEYGHGGDNSKAAVVGRLDEMWRHDLGDGTYEIRYRGVIMPSKPYANLAIEGITDGSLTGVSVKVDSVTLDMTEARDRLKTQLMTPEPAVDAEDGEAPDEASVEAFLDMMFGDGTQSIDWFKEARVRNFDIVHMPAYVEGFIALGGAFEDELTDADRVALAACGCYQSSESDGDEVEEVFEGVYASADFAPGTKDGPGWITHPRATARIRRYWVKGKGAAKIAWGAPGDFNRCRNQLRKYVSNPEWLAGLCANMHKEALGFWPGEHHGARALVASAAAEDRTPLFGLAASAGPAVLPIDYDAVPAEFFADPKLEVETPLTVTKEGRVYGHLATWDACHTGMDGMCMNPPPSTTDYAYFHIGVIDTTDGPLRIGHLTLGTGHISLHATAAQATAHYDKPDAVRAHVRIYEDAIGIAYAGVLKEGLTPAQIREFKTNGAMSGDWRWVNRTQLELIGATAVNTNGFAIDTRQAALAASGGRQISLVTPPVLTREQRQALTASAGWGAPSPTELAGLARAAAREVLAEQKRAERLAAIKPLRDARRAERLARVRSTTERD